MTEICFSSLISRENEPIYLYSTTDAEGKRAESELYNEYLKHNFLSHVALDIFESPCNDVSDVKGDQPSNFLFAQDGISVYGFESNTGLKIVIGCHARGDITAQLIEVSELLTFTNNEIFGDIHRAYLRVVCSPFGDRSGKLETTFGKKLEDIVKAWNERNNETI